MKVILVSVCSSRKKTSQFNKLSASDLPFGDQNSVTSAWLNSLNVAKGTMILQKMYASRAAKIMRELSKDTGNPLYFISAGLGFVNSESTFPSYDLTISRNGDNSISKKIKVGNFDISKWWSDINTGDSHPITSLVRNNPDSFFVCALSSSYFEMIKKDLQNLSKQETERFRIIGIKINPGEKLYSSLLPYDYRFNGPDSPIPGTFSDFSQRCASHYIRHVLPMVGLIKDIDYVRSYMKTIRPPKKIVRSQKSDFELLSLMKERLMEGYISGTGMLRYLRDKKRYACEQKRCSLIYKEALRSMLSEKKQKN